MIYFLYGGDIDKARAKSKSLLQVLFSKKPNAGFFKFGSDNFNQTEIDSLIGGQGLFEKKYIVQLDGLFADKEQEIFLLNKLEELQSSNNIFIFIEGQIKKSLLTKIIPLVNQVQEFPKIKQKQRDYMTEQGSFSLGDFKIFDLATCFGERDKKRLWILFQEARRRDIPLEEISGIIFWQLKTMFQALGVATATEAQLKPFIFNKAKRFLKKYSKQELKQLSARLVALYHDARRNVLEFDLALEKFILEL